MLHFALVWFGAVVWEGTQLTGYHCNGAGQTGVEPDGFMLTCRGKALNKQNRVTVRITILLVVEAPNSIWATEPYTSQAQTHTCTELARSPRYQPFSPWLSPQPCSWNCILLLPWHLDSASMARSEAAMEGGTYGAMLCPPSAVSWVWRSAFN